MSLINKLFTAVIVVLVLWIILGVVLITHAQDARVIILNSGDATRVKQVYDAKVKADKAWDDEVASIRISYTMMSHKKPVPIGEADYLPGWENGITFSDDFRTIVPNTKPFYSATQCLCGDLTNNNLIPCTCSNPNGLIPNNQGVYQQ